MYKRQTQASINNLNEQVQQYSLLIANKQAELEASQAEEQRLNEQYKTRIRSMDHSVVIITNSQICASTVQNTALRTMRPYKFTLGVTYGTTRAQLEKLMADLQAMLDNSPYTNKGTNIVRLTSFGDSSINILISAYLTTNVYATFLQQQNDLNLNIMDVMQADGVDFAFPSTSVYIEKN